ncbi:methyltransferase domain-containing protein [Alcanivorax sp. S6407]|uniref:class I SAM-dependent methyltransferase n=1 Tax=Alcanivorax sp. S6407 TaxID=2926424 RepID=UPI001FF2AEA9|nr:class I SAM-dependent methyltransferase [Alcanivorax sp. S6407]MCK0152597.1 methyltransferase domain-containing protein [Alcanivorax sp. S6407]
MSASGVVIRAGEPHTIRTRGITLLRSGHKEIRRLKRANHTPSIHGNKVWNSSFLIMDHLTRQKMTADQHLLDIGCGWGPLSVFAAKRFGCQVTAVDADEDVFPYLDLHAQINKVDIEQKVLRFEKLTQKMLGKVDIMAGADICFWDELTPVLYNLIRRALRAGVQEIIIADPGRSPFYALAEKCEQAGLDSRVVERRTKTPKNLCADLLIINN